MEMKMCSGCGKELPATTEYFAVHKRTKSGLRARCKECNGQYRLENKERIKKYREENKERRAERFRKYREENKERLTEYSRKYREENKERIKKYREENKERMTEYGRKHREENRELYRSYTQRRTSLKRSLPSTLTINQWQHVQSYFNHGCAYCGSATTLEQDHF